MTVRLFVVGRHTFNVPNHHKENFDARIIAMHMVIGQ